MLHVQNPSLGRCARYRIQQQQTPAAATADLHDSIVEAVLLPTIEETISDNVIGNQRSKSINVFVESVAHVQIPLSISLVEKLSNVTPVGEDKIDIDVDMNKLPVTVVTFRIDEVSSGVKQARPFVVV